MFDKCVADLYGEVHFDLETFAVTCAVHPSTYLNKILLGSQQGQLQLWNIRTSKLVYTFQGWGSQVQILTQSPAVDIVGVGLENGSIVIHNLKYDETVMRFHQEWGPVTSMSFRTGDGVKLDKSNVMCIYIGIVYNQVTCVVKKLVKVTI